jgi:hypothetical protein
MEGWAAHRRTHRKPKEKIQMTTKTQIQKTTAADAAKLAIRKAVDAAKAKAKAAGNTQTTKPTVKVTKEAPKAETAPKVMKVGNECCCGCGGVTSGPKRLFLPGHDARLYGFALMISKGKAKIEDIAPVTIQNMAKLPKLMADERTAKVLRDAAALRSRTTRKAA